jgi:AraC family transcriptional regulator of adaptative response/methylated-DNA-[protein]-cysteine methyltransferase
MLFTPHTPETLYAALLARDPAFDGHAYVCVTTTGIFCRLTCPARKPKFENTRFFASIAECAAAGFRPCQRCQPLNHLTSRDDLTANLLAQLNRHPEKPWSEDDLIAMGHDPSTIRRAFKRNFGMTFLDLARLRRAGLGLDTLATGAPVISAQLDAGYESASGFRDAITRLIGDTPAALKSRDLLKADWLDTPIGQMLAIADHSRLHLLEFFDRKALPAELVLLRTRTRAAISFGRLAPIDSIEAELAAYFQGHLKTFTTPFARDHTEFTKAVWQALTTIPYGTTTSYGALAAELGHPTASRAVARANGANQLALVIPCHRVIGADGALTGYGGQVWRKQWLLEHERKYCLAG